MKRQEQLSWLQRFVDLPVRAHRGFYRGKSLNDRMVLNILVEANMVDDYLTRGEVYRRCGGAIGAPNTVGRSLSHLVDIGAVIDLSEKADRKGRWTVSDTFIGEIRDYVKGVKG